MTEPFDHISVFASVAKRAVDESQATFVDAFRKINRETSGSPESTFTPGDAIRVLSKLTDIAITSGVEMSRAALEIEPDKNIVTLADYIATIVGQTVHDVTHVANDAAELVDTKSYSSNEWTQSAIKLANIGLLRFAEISQSIAAGPAKYANPIVKETFTIPVDVDNDRRISLVSLKLDGPAGGPPVPKFRVSIEPPDRVISAGADSFTVVVNTSGLTSGVYVGSVAIEAPSTEHRAPSTFPFMIAL